MCLWNIPQVLINKVSKSDPALYKLRATYQHFGLFLVFLHHTQNFPLCSHFLQLSDLTIHITIHLTLQSHSYSHTFALPAASDEHLERHLPLLTQASSHRFLIL